MEVAYGGIMFCLTVLLFVDLSVYLSMYIFFLQHLTGSAFTLAREMRTKTKLSYIV